MSVLVPGVAKGAVIGGYDVAAIARETVAVLADRAAITGDEAVELEANAAALPSNDALLAAGPLLDIYEKIFALLVTRGVLSAGEAAEAKALAARSGGVKAGGMNPLVLAAACLDILAGKGLLSRGEAQQLLDKAKIKA